MLVALISLFDGVCGRDDAGVVGEDGGSEAYELSERRLEDEKRRRKHEEQSRTSCREGSRSASCSLYDSHPLVARARLTRRTARKEKVGRIREEAVGEGEQANEAQRECKVQPELEVAAK
jgi:hypothetical protein